MDIVIGTCWVFMTDIGVNYGLPAITFLESPTHFYNFGIGEGLLWSLGVVIDTCVRVQ